MAAGLGSGAQQTFGMPGQAGIDMAIFALTTKVNHVPFDSALTRKHLYSCKKNGKRAYLRVRCYYINMH